MPKIFDIAVIGGGIVGISSAMALQSTGHFSVIVLEAEDKIASHQTGNNSGVIHSGLYYKPGSLKALNCTEGRQLLYEFCSENEIRHERCGKIVVAVSSAEVQLLDELEKRGAANGLEGIKKLSAGELKEYEPNVSGSAALFIPQTGIVNYSDVAAAFSRILLESGGEIELGTRFTGLKKDGDILVLETSSGEVRCRNLVNCGGLYSDKIAALCGTSTDVRIVPFRGEYYKLKKHRENLVRNLVYPVPDPKFPFLGVHFTRMIDGGVEAGPNAVLAFKREGYRKTDFSLRETAELFRFPGFWRMASRHYKMGLHEYYRSFNKSAFVKALQRLVPAITPEDIEPGGAGVRAQALDRNGKLIDDFRIEQSSGMIHVLNAPSPAATASISIGRKIARLAETSFG